MWMQHDAGVLRRGLSLTERRKLIVERVRDREFWERMARRGSAAMKPISARGVALSADEPSGGEEEGCQNEKEGQEGQDAPLDQEWHGGQEIAEEIKRRGEETGQTETEGRGGEESSGGPDSVGREENLGREESTGRGTTEQELSKAHSSTTEINTALEKRHAAASQPEQEYTASAESEYSVRCLGATATVHAC